MFLTKRLPTSISNTFTTGHVARYITRVTKERAFFNRKQELVKFKEAFSGDPDLHVILGPPSTGKTALVREVTSKGDFNPFFINCREGQFDTPTSLYQSISSQFQPFFKNYAYFLKTLFKKGEVSYMINDTEFKPFGGNKERTFTPDDVTDLLSKIGNSLPKWSCWNGINKSPPILVIDEVNMFSQLATSVSGETLLQSILNWMVVNTKEKGRFQIVLTSSDSYITNWLEDHLYIPHTTSYVVGDLNKEEAEEYFEKYALPRYGCTELEGKFDHVCKITGTRMIIIDKYVREYKSKGEISDNRFSVYQSQYDKLRRGLLPESLKYLSELNPPLWKRDDLIKTMEALMNAKDQGYILEADLIEAIGVNQVNSLIYYGFLHRRPTDQYYYDINWPGETILTAMDQPSLRAMECILSKKT